MAVLVAILAIDQAYKHKTDILDSEHPVNHDSYVWANSSTHKNVTSVNTFANTAIGQSPGLQWSCLTNNSRSSLGSFGCFVVGLHVLNVLLHLLDLLLLGLDLHSRKYQRHPLPVTQSQKNS